MKYIKIFGLFYYLPWIYTVMISSSARLSKAAYPLANSLIFIYLFICLLSLDVTQKGFKKHEEFVFKYSIYELPRFIKGGIIEELLFRLPLLVLFDGPSQQFWITSIVFSVLFGLIHLPNYKFLFISDSGNVINGVVPKVIKIFNVTAFAGIFGLGLSYLLVVTKSIFLTISIHILWNYLVITITPLIKKQFAE